jgi:hypothetical protein
VPDPDQPFYLRPNHKPFRFSQLHSFERPHGQVASDEPHAKRHAPIQGPHRPIPRRHPGQCAPRLLQMAASPRATRPKTRMWPRTAMGHRGSGAAGDPNRAPHRKGIGACRAPVARRIGPGFSPTSAGPLQRHAPLVNKAALFPCGSLSHESPEFRCNLYCSSRATERWSGVRPTIGHLATVGWIMVGLDAQAVTSKRPKRALDLL